VGEEFEGVDLSESGFWGVELRNSTFRDVDFSGSSMHNVLLADVDIDGIVERLVVNGVDVTAHVHAGDPWQPLRSVLRPADRARLLDSLDAFDRAWDEAIQDARRLPEETLHASVDGEWSFVETLRHLVFAIDKWFTHPVAGGSFHPIGIPNTGSRDVPWPGLDPSACPTLEEAVAARADRRSAVRAFVVDADDASLSRPVEVIENGATPTFDCVLVVIEEEFGHLRYARRDLATLSASTT
jgi:hypothetical protein